MASSKFIKFVKTAIHQKVVSKYIKNYKLKELDNSIKTQKTTSIGNTQKRSSSGQSAYISIHGNSNLNHDETPYALNRQLVIKKSVNNMCWERSRSKETCTMLVGVHLRNYLKMPLETFWHHLVKARLKA